MPRDEHTAHGVYRVEVVRVVDVREEAKKKNADVDEEIKKHPYRIQLTLGEYTHISGFNFGIDNVHAKLLTKQQYQERFN